MTFEHRRTTFLILLSHSELGLAASGLGYLWESPRSLTLAWCTFSAQVALEPEVHPHQHPSRTWVAHCPLALVLLSIPVRVCFWLIYYQHVQNILSSKSLSLTSVSACLKISGLEALAVHCQQCFVGKVDHHVHSHLFKTKNVIIL